MNLPTVDTHTTVSPLKLFLTEFGESRVSVVAVVLLGLIILLAVGAPLITPQDPYDLAKLVLTDARRPPGFVGSNGFTHWLGTDAQGRDLFSAILYGLRISIQVGLMAGAIAFSLGASLGTRNRCSLSVRCCVTRARSIDSQLRLATCRSCPGSPLMPTATILGGSTSLRSSRISARRRRMARTSAAAPEASRPARTTRPRAAPPLATTKRLNSGAAPNADEMTAWAPRLITTNAVARA